MGGRGCNSSKSYVSVVVEGLMAVLHVALEPGSTSICHLPTHAPPTRPPCWLQGDCIPPHIDSMDFARPFCTVSLLSEQSIMFAQKLVPAGPGEFTARDGCRAVSIPLPKGEWGQDARRLLCCWQWWLGGLQCVSLCVTESPSACLISALSDHLICLLWLPLLTAPCLAVCRRLLPRAQGRGWGPSHALCAPRGRSAHQHHSAQVGVCVCVGVLLGGLGGGIATCAALCCACFATAAVHV
jgi:hypothetical protein